MNDTFTPENARLIAAAPELLAACKAAIAALSQPVQFTKQDDRVFDNRPVQILRGDAKFAREILEKAVAKATNTELIVLESCTRPFEHGQLKHTAAEEIQK